MFLRLIVREPLLQEKIFLSGIARITSLISFQKMYGLYGLKHHTVEIKGNVTLEDTQAYM